MRTRHYTCPTCGTTKLLHLPNNGHRFPKWLSCRTNGCVGYALATKCQVNGCEEDYYNGCVAHVILNDIQHTFKFCVYHKRLTEVDLVRPVRVIGNQLVIEKVPAIPRN